MEKGKEKLGQGTLASNQDADSALNEISVLQFQMEQARLRAEKLIEPIRAKLAAEAEPLAAEIAALEKSLCAFAKTQRSQWLPAKSIELTFGVIGFRNSGDGLKYPPDADLVAELEARKFGEYVRLKKEPDKEKLLADREQLGLAVLSHLGITPKVGRDKFYYEIKAEQPPAVPGSAKRA